MKKHIGFIMSVGALLVLSTGCATKTHVRKSIDQSIEPIETRLGKVEEETSGNSRRITEVDQNAQTGIGEAKTQASAASQEATKAGERASRAEALAQKGIAETERISEELRNADNFQLLKAETVHFAFNRSDLDEEATRAIDGLASTLQSTKRYVIEVQGFADPVGPEEYNLDLSRRRADTVVRYLTMVHKIPLARVFEVGYGEEKPDASDNSREARAARKSREARERSRRVEIRVMAVQQAAEQTGRAQASTSGEK